MVFVSPKVFSSFRGRPWHLPKISGICCLPIPASWSNGLLTSIHEVGFGKVARIPFLQKSKSFVLKCTGSLSKYFVYYPLALFRMRLNSDSEKWLPVIKKLKIKNMIYNSSIQTKQPRTAQEVVTLKHKTWYLRRRSCCSLITAPTRAYRIPQVKFFLTVALVRQVDEGLATYENWGSIDLLNCTVKQWTTRTRRLGK